MSYVHPIIDNVSEDEPDALDEDFESCFDPYDEPDDEDTEYLEMEVSGHTMLIPVDLIVWLGHEFESKYIMPGSDRLH